MVFEKNELKPLVQKFLLGFAAGVMVAACLVAFDSGDGYAAHMGKLSLSRLL